jgi:hypothetical protein
MRPIPLIITATLFLSLLSTNGFANPPIPLTDCETITQRGNYVLENDLVTSPGRDCLVINSSHVNVDLNGQAITCIFSVEFPIPCNIGDGLGGTGIDIEADHVSIANGGVENYELGIFGNADHISATNLNLATFTGIVLNDVSYSVFANIGYGGLGLVGPEESGPVLSVSGGGHNTFTSIGAANTFAGIIISNSSNNVIEGADLFCSAEGEAGPGILLTQESNHNSITNSSILVLFGSGIEVDLDSDHNVIQDNTVEILSPLGFFALLDQNPDCGSNVWTDNTFSSIFPPGQIGASPADCIH